MKENQRDMVEVCKDLLLTVPYLWSYEMFDWMILSISLSGYLLILKKRTLGACILSMSDLLWISYDLYHGEYAQSLLFLCHFLVATLFVWESLSRKCA